MVDSVEVIKSLILPPHSQVLDVDGGAEAEEFRPMRRQSRAGHLMMREAAAAAAAAAAASNPTSPTFAGAGYDLPPAAFGAPDFMYGPPPSWAMRMGPVPPGYGGAGGLRARYGGYGGGAYPPAYYPAAYQPWPVSSFHAPPAAPDKKARKGFFPSRPGDGAFAASDDGGEGEKEDASPPRAWSRGGTAAAAPTDPSSYYWDEGDGGAEEEPAVVVASPPRARAGSLLGRRKRSPTAKPAAAPAGREGGEESPPGEPGDAVGAEGPDA